MVPATRFIIELGLELGKTYTEIYNEMSCEEINLYVAYYQIKSSEAEAQKAKAKAKS